MHCQRQCKQMYRQYRVPRMWSCTGRMQVLHPDLAGITHLRGKSGSGVLKMSGSAVSLSQILFIS